LWEHAKKGKSRKVTNGEMVKACWLMVRWMRKVLGGRYEVGVEVAGRKMRGLECCETVPDTLWYMIANCKWNNVSRWE
jgi:hypothetical protein